MLETTHCEKTKATASIDLDTAAVESKIFESNVLTSPETAVCMVELPSRLCPAVLLLRTKTRLTISTITITAIIVATLVSDR